MCNSYFIHMYKVQVLMNGQMRDTTWPPRPYRAATALARAQQKLFPQYSYWLCRID